MSRAALLVALVLSGAGASAERWLELNPEDRPVTIDASGIVVSTDLLRFGPPPSRNWALTISHLAEEGKRVAEGDLLVAFDGGNADNRVRELASNLEVARGELESLIEKQAREMADEKIALATIESEAKKANRKAEQPPELIASVEYRKLVEHKRLADEKLKRARQRAPLVQQLRNAERQEIEVRVRRLEIQHAAATRELEALTVRAPRSGTVIIGTTPMWGNKLDVGNQVNPGIAVVELANEDRLAVQAEIPEHAAARLAVGQRVRVVVDSAGGAEIEGRIHALANTVRRKSQQAQVMVRDITVRFPTDAPSGLRLGMSVQISVEVAVLRNVLAVPATSLSYRSGSPGVVLKGGSWVPVVLGERSGDRFVVAGGLEAGQEIRL